MGRDRSVWHVVSPGEVLATCSCTCFADLGGCVHKVRPLGTFFCHHSCVGQRFPHSGRWLECCLANCDMKRPVSRWGMGVGVEVEVGVGWVDAWDCSAPPLCPGPPCPGGSGAPGSLKSWCIAPSPLWPPGHLLPLPLRLWKPAVILGSS